MSIQKLFNEICEFCKVYPTIPGGLPDTDKRALQVVAKLKALAEQLVLEEKLPKGWRVKITEGAGAFPRVPWIAFLPTGQEVAKGVYVVICFGKNGEGAVAGCIRSATHMVALETVVRKGRGVVPAIDVDGIKPWAKYNNCFNNPREFFALKLDEAALIEHLRESIKVAETVLGQTALAVHAISSQSGKDITFACASDFCASLAKHGVLLPDGIPLVSIAALLSKRLQLLTGLSGSGKTILAQCIAKWIMTEKEIRNPLRSGVEVKSTRSTYRIVARDDLGVKVNQSGQDSLTFLPFDLINVWVEVIKKNDFCESTSSTEIEKAVIEHGIKYSPALNSFHAPLKALALHVISQGSAYDHKGCEMIAVGADWTSNENLLGYPDALSKNSYRKPDNGALDLILMAKDDPDNPYFLILDEMNLSHVERYFADFLSAMESGQPINLHDDTGSDWDGVPAKLKIPDNLFVIGTVNVDETTYMFSPKVLDRANVIEFRVSKDEMKDFLGNPIKPDLEAIAGQGAQYAKAFVSEARDKNVQLDVDTRAKVSAELMELFPQLQEAGAEFGYRTAHEICRFVYFHKKLSGEGWKFEDAMDAAIMQKLLPKLHGSKKKLGPVLEKLDGLCSGRFTASIEKIGRMRKRLAEHGFTSFAEA